MANAEALHPAASSAEAVDVAGTATWRAPLALIRKDVLLASLGINVLSLGLPLVVLQVYDRIIPNAAWSTLTMLMIGLAVVLAADLALKLARAYVTGWAGAQFEHATGTRAVNKLLYADLRAVEEVPPGAHLDRLNAIDPIRDFYASEATLAIVDLPFVLLFLGLLALIGGTLVLVPIVLLILFSLVAVLLGVKLRAALAARNTWDDRRYNFIIEALTGIHTIKSMAMEKLMQRRYERLMESASSSGYWVVYFGNLAQGAGSAFSQVTMAMIAAAGALLVIDEQMSAGALAASTLLGGRAVQPLLRALGLWTRFQSIRLSEQKLAELERMKPERAAAHETGPIATIELRNVGFRYHADGSDVLKHVNMTIEPGEMIGIKGENGAGKTTLLWLLMGGIVPTTGEIRVGGVSTAEAETASLRRQIAYLPQRPVLFEGTVMDNITMFDSEGNLEQAQGLAEKLGLDQVFARMPGGWDTKIGAQADDTLPGGVVQRIALARGLMGSPRLILFDEANSSLDQASDDRLRTLLMEYKGRATIVLVSYRPSLLALCDRRFYLNDGSITAQETRP